jgi:hypothetical protein
LRTVPQDGCPHWNIRCADGRRGAYGLAIRIPRPCITTRRKGERKYGHTENFSVSIPELGEIRWKSSLSDGTFAWYNTLVKKELVPAVERFLEKE